MSHIEYIKELKLELEDMKQDLERVTDELQTNKSDKLLAHKEHIEHEIQDIEDALKIAEENEQDYGGYSTMESLGLSQKDFI
jgi:lipid II:glycine glycyltransferase (peptidoglycan interpeptide bridge formation enzyme)